MKLTQSTILSYENFNNLSNDIMLLAKEIMPDKIIYINFLNDNIQMTMKVSEHDTKVTIDEGDITDVMDAICNQINYKDGKTLVIEDTSKFAVNKRVKETIKNGNIGSYLGIPILFKNGARFGALCAAHHDESSFEEKDILLLEKIAKLYSYYLELENIAYIDALTSLANSQYLLIHQKDILETGGLAMLMDLDYFKGINDNLGHHVGDLILKEVGDKLINFGLNFKDVHTIRLGGDEFFIYIKDKLSDKEINDMLKNLINDLSKWRTEINGLKLSSSIGAYRFKENEFSEFTNLFKKVDSLLYEAKNKGRNRFIYKKNKL